MKKVIGLMATIVVVGLSLSGCCHKSCEPPMPPCYKGEAMEQRGEMLEQRGAALERTGARMERRGRTMERQGMSRRYQSGY